MRKPTPNIMDELMPAKSETTELRAGLKWDYSQLGEAASEVMGHAIEIKRVEKRASEAIVEAGRHLIAVKQSLSHGQWEDWLQTEFAMSDRTARRMMAVAEQFDGKTDTVSVLGPSVLYLLAGDSVPEPAREAVIDLAKSGETVTKAQAQAVINQHKPSRPTPGERYLAGLPALNMTTPTATPAGTYSTPLGNLPKNPIEDWELEDIVEQVAQEYYGSVTATAGAEMTHQSQAHAGEYWAKLRRVLEPFDLTTERIEAAVTATVERLVGERRALRPGSPEAKALTREIKTATWADRAASAPAPQRLAEVGEIERTLAAWAQPLDASVLRSTALTRGGALWWEARNALQALGTLNYRDKDLVSALQKLASQKEQRVDALPIEQVIAPTPQPPVSADVAAAVDTVTSATLASVLIVEDAVLFAVAHKTNSVEWLTDYGKAARIKDTFDYDGRRWVSVGTLYDGIRGYREAQCVRVHEIDEEIAPGETASPFRQGAYCGNEVICRGRKCKLGAQWIRVRERLASAPASAAVERLVGERRALRPGSPEAKALAREIKAATWADRRGPVVEKGRGGERKTTQTASALTVDGDLTAADVQVLQPMPPTEPEMVPLAAVSRLGHVIGTALGAAATSPTVEAGIARARELLVTPTPPADDRRTRLSQYAAQFEATLAALRDWAQLTGRFTLTSEAERGLHRVLEATRSELAALNGQPHQVWGEETTI